MRETSRYGGPTVAGVVAMLERQQTNGALKCPSKTEESVPAVKSPLQFQKSDQKPIAPRRPGRKRQSPDDANLDRAIESFNSVAEDVERIVAATRGVYEEDGEDSEDGGTVSTGSERGGDGPLETITEEERCTASSVSEGSAVIYNSEGDSSSIDDEDTVKGEHQQQRTTDRSVATTWSEGTTTSNRDSSTSDLSTSSACSEHQPGPRDSSTRCNGDFQWFFKQDSTKMDCKPPPGGASTRREKPPKRERSAPGSLDRRRHHHHNHSQPQQNRSERDLKSRSSYGGPPKLEDYLPPPPPPPPSGSPCQNWCCRPPEPPAMLFSPTCYETFHRRHERNDPQRYGSSPMLMGAGSDRGSHPDLFGDSGRYRWDGCCGYHMPPPPPCCYFGERGERHWMGYGSKFPEHDEKIRKLQSEKDNLQLQVQVLSEQIEAQSDKIADLEKTLGEKKQLLSNAEEMLQREVLSRSSLETQKLELLSAMSELKLQQAALERENMELRASHCNNNSSLDTVKKPPLLSRMSPQPHTSTPVSHTSRLSSPGAASISSVSPTRRFDSDRDLQAPKTPPATYRRQIDIRYGSLPRQQFISNGTSVQVDSNANPAAVAAPRKGVAFGRGISSLLGGRARGHSVPNLAESEKVIDVVGNEGPQSPTLSFNKNKGIKKIFGKIKRSNSGTLEDIPGIGDFQRGGVRATAAARLGWSEPQLTVKPDKPFSEWDTENICDWLQDLSLDQYIPEAKKWVKSGQQLQEAPINEIEKELGIKNPLHRKKLQLALIDTEENSSSDLLLSKAGKLDTAWVLRWLDDVGLPQYKENFLVNRVDGRVLHRLTMDDLALLHVSNLLHVASLKRGIQVLRENDYEAGCLQRRSLPDDPVEKTPKMVSLWTTHRVMEWLRAVDLAEYAPNLRGAGVHGGLMVLETKFTAELLAALLSIPPGKTLLRRHLNTHFKELLGKDIIQEKREAESTLGYIPLTPTAKVKVTKKSQFSLKRKKSKGEADYGDLVCPMNPSQSGELNGSNSVGTKTMERLKEEDVCLLADDTSSDSQSCTNSPVPKRH